ncbi:MAG TPA: hypothetical protein VFE06_10145 [Acidobacteriaceae bacterium]|jgi:hypothetical protein|nr:hypothetical protein [Acidobacteriaceae bacterium]
MNAGQRPVPVLIVACLFIAVGVLGFGYHFRELLTLQKDNLWVEGTELTALVCAVFLLRGRNWARWLAVAWAALHVMVSALNAFHGIVAHSVLFVLISWLLFRPEAGRYFRDAQPAP